MDDFPDEDRDDLAACTPMKASSAVSCSQSTAPSHILSHRARTVAGSRKCIEGKHNNLPARCSRAGTMDSSPRACAEKNTRRKGNEEEPAISQARTAMAKMFRSRPRGRSSTRGEEMVSTHRGSPARYRRSANDTTTMTSRGTPLQVKLDIHPALRRAKGYLQVVQGLPACASAKKPRTSTKQAWSAVKSGGTRRRFRRAGTGRSTRWHYTTKHSEDQTAELASAGGLPVST